jgi:hypothetical protein
MGRGDVKDSAALIEPTGRGNSEKVPAPEQVNGSRAGGGDATPHKVVDLSH